MLDTCANQGAGLQMSAAGPTGPSLVAVVSHGDRRLELPVLWELSAAITGMGYALAVLDGLSAESAAEPGLQQALELGFVSPDGPLSGAPWTTIAAAQGLRQLCQADDASSQARSRLGEVLQAFGVVLLHTDAETLGCMLAGSAAEPLLLLSLQKQSVITSYQALKHLLLRAGLRPTIVCLTPEEPSLRQGHGSSPVRSLQSCALAFLGFEPKALTMPSQQADGGGALGAFALRLLEGAVSLPSPRAESLWHGHVRGGQGFTGGH